LFFLAWCQNEPAAFPGCNDLQGEQAMFRTALGLGVVFVVIALIAALFGFGVVSSESWFVAKVCFFIFLVLAVLAFVGGFFSRSRSA
jgi:uncharacterized membrane protein YtjA (UPF0391 family)